MKIMSTLLAAAVAWAAPAAHAQDPFPTKPITIVVPFSPGTNSDVIMRSMTPALTATLGQPIIIESRPGAGGAIAMQHVARSAPDGYTLIAVSSSVMVVLPAMLKSLPYDPIKQFTPVAITNKAPLLMTVAATNPANNVSELVTNLKSKGGGTYAHGAPVLELAMEIFARRAGAKLTAIPYKGNSEAVIDLLGGRVDVMGDALASASSLIKSGRIKPIALLSKSRSDLLPELPTMAEQGFAGYDVEGWNGLLAPAGTPPAIVERLAAAVEKAAQDPQVRKVMLNNFSEPWILRPDETRNFIASETTRFESLAREAEIEKR